MAEWREDGGVATETVTVARLFKGDEGAPRAAKTTTMSKGSDIKEQADNHLEFCWNISHSGGKSTDL